MNRPLNLDRKRKTKFPCPDCRLRLELCLCSEIKPIELSTKLTLLIHHKELKRTTNTGVLATKALTNSQMVVRGDIGKPLDLKDYVSQDYQTLLLFPSPDAVELNLSYIQNFSQPVHLLVPDGNWRQASKIHYRNKHVTEIPRVFLPKTDHSMDLLRKESKELGMPTLLAISIAMGILEGPQVADNLFNLFQLKFNRTLQGRP